MWKEHAKLYKKKKKKNENVPANNLKRPPKHFAIFKTCRQNYNPTIFRMDLEG